MSWYHYKPYVSVAERRRSAEKKMAALRKKGVDIQPIVLASRLIAGTFWGKAWCQHLESFSDYANRLPRGRTYVRNGSVCHLAISRGNIQAKVSGSELYSVEIAIQNLPAAKWKAAKNQCAGKIGSLLELLRGQLSDDIMAIVTDRQEGLFPSPKEISLRCSCPDWATMCKHVAAVLYGVGARLDRQPELLFVLRGVDHEELIQADHGAALDEATLKGGAPRVAESDIADVFGIDIQTETPPANATYTNPTRRKRKTSAAPARRKTKTNAAAKKKRNLSKTKKTTAKSQATAAPKTAARRTGNRSRPKNKTGT